MSTPPPRIPPPDEADAELVRRALAALTTREPRTTADLAAELDVDEDELDQVLIGSDALVYFHPNRWANPAVLFDGLVEAHRLSADELELGGILWTADLPLTASIEAPELTTGGTLVLGFDGERHFWTVPDGMLDGAEPGDLLVLHHEQGRIRPELRPTGEVFDVAGDLDELADRILAVVERLRATSDGVEIAEVGAELAHAESDVLSHPVPFGELLDRAGVQLHGDYVLLPDEDPAEWRLQRQRGFIDPEGYYDELSVDAVARLSDARVRARKGPLELDVAAARGLDAGLSDPEVTELAAGHLLSIFGDDDGSVTRMLDTIEQTLPHRPSAGVHVLRARLAEWDGDVEAQQTALRAALARDPDFPPALEDHAWNLEDQGDAAGALSALRRAGVREDDEQVRRLRGLLSEPFPGTGRNEPCPCGSGRKYKRCHLNRTDRELGDRVDWLLAKAITFLHRPPQRREALDLVVLFGTSIEGGELQALGDPLVTAILLFDHGLLDRFLDHRGPLLPADERDLVADWVEHVRFDVCTVTPGDHGGRRLRSLVDDREHELTTAQDAMLLADVGDDDVVATHVIATPAGDRIALAVLRVPDLFVDEAVEAALSDSIGIAAWYEGQLFLRHLAERQQRGG